jgi:hypothetical protein
MKEFAPPLVLPPDPVTGPATMFTRTDNCDYSTDQRPRPPRRRQSRQVTTVRLSHADLLPDLVQALVANGCRPLVLSPSSCAVAHPDPIDDAEAQAEIAFFVRAWALQHPGVVADLTA